MEPNPSDRGVHQPGLPHRMTPHLLPCGGVPAGTNVLTSDGALPVEFLSAGDRIVSRDAGFVAVRGVGRDLWGGAWAMVRAGAFGPGMPEVDLPLPAPQQVLLRGDLAVAIAGQTQVLMPLSELLGQSGFQTCDIGPSHVFAICCGPLQVIYAGGVELSTAGCGDGLDG